MSLCHYHRSLAITFLTHHRHTLLPAIETTDAIGNTENKQVKRNMSKYFTYVYADFFQFRIFILWHVFIFCVSKCCIDHLLCMVDVFRLSGTTDYSNFCYRWRQILAIWTEALIFQLVFFKGEEHVLELWLRHEHFSITRQWPTQTREIFQYHMLPMSIISCSDFIWRFLCRWHS